MKEKLCNAIKATNQDLWSKNAKRWLLLAVFLACPFLANSYLFFGPLPYGDKYGWDYDAAYQALSPFGKMINQNWVLVALWGLSLYLCRLLPTTFLFLSLIGLISIQPALFQSHYFDFVLQDIEYGRGWELIGDWMVMTKFYPVWLALIICACLAILWVQRLTDYLRTEYVSD